MKKERYTVAVIGATGNTGMETLNILHERKFPIDEVVAIASEKSVGKKISFGDTTLQVKHFSVLDFAKIDIAIFCAGGLFSKKNAALVTKSGCVIIDKTSHFRLEPKVPLVVPEINGDILEKGAPIGIISTPNCVAIPLSMTLKALSKIANIKRVVVSTYQSVSGAGRNATNELYNQTKGVFSTLNVKNEVFPKQIAFNVIPIIGALYDNGSTEEEDKIACEIRKILKSSVKVAVTCVRVPVFVGHAMSVACEFDNPVDEAEALNAFDNFDGIVVIDRNEEGIAVTPLDVQGEDGVFVSRIRKDTSTKHGLLYWVVADNLRKGAALNSVQIAEKMIQIDPMLIRFKK